MLEFISYNTKKESWLIPKIITIAGIETHGDRKERVERGEQGGRAPGQSHRQKSQQNQTADILSDYDEDEDIYSDENEEEQNY
jgi:hypothetical protein